MPTHQQNGRSSHDPAFLVAPAALPCSMSALKLSLQLSSRAFPPYLAPTWAAAPAVKSNYCTSSLQAFGHSDESFDDFRSSLTAATLLLSLDCWKPSYTFTAEDRSQ